MRITEEDEVGLKEKPEDTKYIKKIRLGKVQVHQAWGHLGGGGGGTGS